MTDLKDNAPAAAKKAKAPRESVTLTKGHEHKGKPCEAGAKIQVTARQKAWLIKHGKVAG